MVALTDNMWAFRGQDNLDRSHVPAMPLWVGILRVAQFIIAFLVLVLTGVSAGLFESGSLAGFGLAWFTIIWTFAYLVWLFVSVIFTPAIYHYLIHLGIESLTVIWWLCTFALLASEANDLSSLGYYDGIALYAALIGADDELNKYKRAVDTLKASAGIGALEWILFVASSVVLALAILEHRKKTASQAPPPAAPAPAEAPAQMVQPDPTYQPQPGYQQPPAV